MPGILYGTRRRRLAAVLLGLWIASCGRAQVGQTGEPSAPRADSPVRRVQVFLIAPADQGRSGRKVGCGDSVLPVDVPLPQPEAALTGALHALLGLKGRPYHPPSGLYNALYSSTLELVRVDRQGAEARVYLKGYLELGDSCENSRILSELQETALQFSDVSHVQLYLEDQPLLPLLSARGAGKG